MINSTEITMHSQIMKLLPWYVNNTVNEDERKLIHHHLQSCVSCRIELKSQQQFSQRVKYSSDFELTPKQSFSRLKSRIHQAPQSKSTVQSPTAATEPFYVRWLDSFQNLVLSPQAAMVAVGFCMLLFSIDHIVTNRISVATTQFRTLSSAGNAENLAKNDIRVVFASTVTDEQIKQFVSSFDATVIGGPSPSGIYRIRINPVNGQQLSLNQRIDIMRQQQQVVFAEPAYTALVSILQK